MTVHSKKALDMVERERRKVRKLEEELKVLRQNHKVALDALRGIEQESVRARQRLGERN